MMKKIKIVSLNTDHTNTNYVKCLEHTNLLVLKEEADIIALHEIRQGNYGFVTGYPYFKNFSYELEPEVKQHKPFGEFMLSRQKFRDYEYSEGVQVYFYKDHLVAISREPKNQKITDYLRSFTLANGNIKPTILIDPEKIWLLTTAKEEQVVSKQKSISSSKYPLNIALCEFWV
jgi:hypothetical protein